MRLPLFPFCEVPDPIYRAPLVPKLALPVLKISKPLTPVIPALAVWISMSPLDVETLYPVVKATRPPVAIVAVDSEVVPAESISSPPELLSPEPTTM
jgi:hypothetical protein